MANQINNSELTLRDINDTNILIILQSYRLYGFNHTRGTFSVTTTSTATRYEACDGWLLAILLVIYEAASVVLMDEWYQIKALRDIPKAADAR